VLSDVVVVPLTVATGCGFAIGLGAAVICCTRSVRRAGRPVQREDPLPEVR